MFLMSNNTRFYLLLALVVLLAVIIYILNLLYKKRALNQVIEALEENLSSSPEKFNVRKYKTKYSDISCESETSLFLVKIIHNSSTSEICVNSPLMWQVRRSKNDTKNSYLKNIDGLMKHEFSPLELNGRKAKKIYVIYKDSRGLLMYINESEMRFIEPRTNVHGATVVSFNDLVNNDAVELTDFEKRY